MGACKDKRVGPGQSLRAMLECGGLTFIKWSLFGSKALNWWDEGNSGSQHIAVWDYYSLYIEQVLEMVMMGQESWGQIEKGFDYQPQEHGLHPVCIWGLRHQKGGLTGSRVETGHR